MSRTYRKKRVTAEEDWILSDILSKVFHYLESRGIPYNTKEEDILAMVPDAGHYVRYRDAMYHKDTDNLCCAPRSYRKILNSTRRAKEKLETNRILKQGDYFSYCFDKRIKDAASKLF
jgi:hypothetical protein